MYIKAFMAVALVWSLLLALNNFDDDKKALQGSWVIVSAELAGQPLPDEMKADKLVLDGYSYRYRNDHGEIKLVPAEGVKAMDVIGKEGPNKGKTLPAIYKLDGDSLTICYDLTGKARPTQFKTEAGTMQLLITYKREKKE